MIRPGRCARGRLGLRSEEEGCLKYRGVVLAFALASFGLRTGAEVRTATFHSESLGRDVTYAVDLPSSYADGGGPYPTIYALHGLFESSAFWERRGLAPIFRSLVEAREIPEAIVVLPDGGNSFFVNASGGRFQDLVTRDIIAHVESTYRVVPGRKGRALLGISMGGYAALRIALFQPGTFGAVATHSAMVLQQVPSAAAGAGRWHMSAFSRVFGDPIDEALWTASDPLAWAEKAVVGEVPPLYFDCGSEDRFGLFAGNEALHARLDARGIRHEFALRPGDHGYEYVRTVLPASLRFLGAALRGTDARAAGTTGR
jgi:S-formylglutathione hydrolase FrmB